MGFSNVTPSEPVCQLHRNHILRATLYLAQSALLLRRQRTDVFNRRDAACLREIADCLQRFVSTLNRLGRAVEPGDSSERIPAPTLDESVTAGGTL